MFFIMNEFMKLLILNVIIRSLGNIYDIEKPPDFFF